MARVIVVAPSKIPSSRVSNLSTSLGFCLVVVLVSIQSTTRFAPLEMARASVGTGMLMLACDAAVPVRLVLCAAARPPLLHTTAAPAAPRAHRMFKFSRQKILSLHNRRPRST